MELALSLLNLMINPLHLELADGWHRLGPKVLWKQRGSFEYYDEPALRRTMTRFLSDESRKRFGGTNFCDEASYYKSLEWFLQGLRLFYLPS